MLRRAMALGAGVIVLILLVLGVRGCLDSRADNALKDYNRDVNTIVTDSNEQVSKRLFELLSTNSDSALGIVPSVNRLRQAADDDFKRAEALDVPGDMEAAQRHLLAALSLRREGVAAIASDLRDIGGDRKRAAAERIAGSMRLFLASDVLFSQRVDPYILEVFGNHDIQGQDIVKSQFLPDDTWLSATTVGDRLGVAGAGSSSGSTPTAGTHGHGLVSVKIGDSPLQPSPANNRVTLSATTVFTVDFQNQGENDEFDVAVRVKVGSAAPVTKRVDQTEAGKPATAQIRVTDDIPTGTPVRVRVTIAAVPGEKTTSNNSQDYTVTFSR